MATFWVASDWHLGSASTPHHGPLACAFLRQARAADAHVVLNGDIYEGLFEPMAEAEAALPAPLRLMQDMAAAGRLTRLCGNHDPAGGPLMTVVEAAKVGRVLVSHGHAADPWQRSGARLGDAISRKYGKTRLVRAWAHLAETVMFKTVGPQVLRMFEARCTAMTRREGCALGIFGHVHHRHLAPGCVYANAGWLRPDRLEYLVLDDDGPSLRTLTAAEAV